MKENRIIYMRNIKDILLYLDSFDEDNMFDLEHSKKIICDVLEVLRYEMNRRAIKYNLNYCEDAILNLLHLVVEVDDMINFKRPGILQEVKKLYDAVSLYENDSDTENESDEYANYIELSEYSNTGKIIGSRKL